MRYEIPVRVICSRNLYQMFIVLPKPSYRGRLNSLQSISSIGPDVQKSDFLKNEAGNQINQIKNGC